MGYKREILKRYLDYKDDVIMMYDEMFMKSDTKSVKMLAEKLKEIEHYHKNRLESGEQVVFSSGDVIGDVLLLTPVDEFKNLRDAVKDIEEHKIVMFQNKLGDVCGPNSIKCNRSLNDVMRIENQFNQLLIGSTKHMISR